MHPVEPEPIIPSETLQKTETEQLEFFNAALERALSAEAVAGRRRRCIAVAGVTIDLSFAGPRLEAEFMGALGHLEIALTDEADTTLHIWDTASTGVRMVPPPCERSAFTDRGDIWGFSSTRIRSAFQWSEFSVCLLNLDNQQGVYWVHDALDLPYWAKSSPMRTLFHWIMEDRGNQLVHAAAVGTENGGVLVTGKGGVGKSTTALACLTSGMTYIGDDYVIVSLDPEPTAWTLFSTAKLEPHQAQRFPGLTPLMRGPKPASGEKAVIYLYPDHKSQIVHSLPLKYVLTPRFGSEAETTFEPISSMEMHRAAAFTTMSQLAHAGLRTHDFIGRLMNRTTTRRMVLGHDVQGVPVAIAHLLSAHVEAQALSARTAADKPLVTVIIPVFNGAHFLKDAVASVLAQDYAAVEIIVVDDGSADDIEGAVAKLPVDVRFFRQTNNGPASARNRGVRDASGAYFAFLDVDDLWPAGHLNTMVNLLEDDPDLEVAMGRGQLARIDPQEPNGLRFEGNPDEAYPTYIGAAVYRPSVFAKVGLFDEKMQFAEDTDWFARARELGVKRATLDQISLIVRRHDGNMTKGRSMVQLNVLLAFKKALDRRRQAADEEL